MNPTSHHGANLVIIGYTAGCDQYDGKVDIMKTLGFLHHLTCIAKPNDIVSVI